MLKSVIILTNMYLYFSIRGLGVKMKINLKISFILTILVIAMFLFSACNTDKTSGNSGSAIANADKPGEELDISIYLTNGKINIVDFYSEYCPPCKKISPLLSKLDKKRDDIVVVKLDINRPGVRGIDWRSPLAKQYGLNSIPHFKIYDENGDKIAEGNEAYQKAIVYIQESGIELN